jgi:hypothetical protein
LRLTSALVVDEVKKHPNGQVDLLGLFEDLYFDTLPITLDSLSLFLDIELSSEDRGKKHELIFILIGPEDQPLGEPWQIKFTVPSEAEYDRSSVQLDPTLFSLTFQKFGNYAIQIQHNSVVLRRLPLYVHQN